MTPVVHLHLLPETFQHFLDEDENSQSFDPYNIHLVMVADVSEIFESFRHLDLHLSTQLFVFSADEGLPGIEPEICPGRRCQGLLFLVQEVLRSGRSTRSLQRRQNWRSWTLAAGEMRMDSSWRVETTCGTEELIFGADSWGYHHLKLLIVWFVAFLCFLFVDTPTITRVDEALTN